MNARPASALLLVCALATPARADERITEFWEATPAPASGERTLLATLQGLVNEQRFRLWVTAGGLCAHVRDEFAAGAMVHPLATVWDAVDAFKGDVAGMVVYAAGTSSVNIATSLCGPLSAVAVEAGLVDAARAHGLRTLLDARGLDQMAVWDQYRGRFGRGLLVEQDPAKDLTLRDFAVARHAFVFWQLPDEAVLRLLRESGPGTTVFGWGSDEQRSVALASRGGGDYLAADWSMDLSALARLPVAIPPRPAAPPPADAVAGERIVAFVMSDGDNLCFVGGDFVDHPAYYGSPHRGTFAMTWEMAPRLAELDSRGLRWLYRMASHGPAWDDFVMGPSGAAYCFPDLMPDRAGFAKRTAAWVPRCGMDVVSLLNVGGDLGQAADLLAQPQIAGVLYKDWAPYNARHGAVAWYHGKPCVAYRSLLWEGMPGQDPEGVAATVAALPAAPATDPDSYALVNVHAWSWRSSGGAMAAVKRTIGLLPPRTRVVTAHDFIALMTRHLAPAGK